MNIHIVECIRKNFLLIVVHDEKSLETAKERDL